MNDFRDQEVLITGAASGIGRETAFAFAREGANLHLVDLDADGLEATARLCRAAGVQARCHVVDVSDAAAMDALADAVHRDVPALDVLVNNAGIGAAGRFVDTTMETWEKTLGVNVMGVVHGCRAFVPAMVARGRGHIVNVASLAGLVAPPEMPVYATSKFAVVGFSESLRGDLRGDGVGVSCICPGIIDTPIVARTRYEGESMSSSDFRERVQKLYRKRNYPPDRVAEAILEAVRRNTWIVPVAPESWFLWLSQRLAPGLPSRLSNIGAVVGGGRR